jgi:exonuclease III
MLKVIAWNIAGRESAWRSLLDSDADVALLQEATKPPDDVAQKISVDAAPWRTDGAILRRGTRYPAVRRWRTVVAQLSENVRVKWLEPKTFVDACPGELTVSRLGTLAAAIVTQATGESLVVASVYAPWENQHSAIVSSWRIYADASAHRVISDLSVLIGQETGHRILVAGDLNILYGYGERGSAYWSARYDTVFNRMKALGLSFVGPQAPNGCCADPWPAELPCSSKNVPTFRKNIQNPASATRQLDFVFASNALAGHVQAVALNDPEQWGPSDHCRVKITVT